MNRALRRGSGLIIYDLRVAAGGTLALARITRKVILCAEEKGIRVTSSLEHLPALSVIW